CRSSSSRNGRLPTGARGLGVDGIIARKRVPNPPTRRTAFVLVFFIAVISQKAFWGTRVRTLNGELGCSGYISWSQYSNIEASVCLIENNGFQPVSLRIFFVLPKMI